MHIGFHASITVPPRTDLALLAFVYGILLTSRNEISFPQLFALTGVPPERQKITAGIKKIEDSTDLKTLGIKPNQVCSISGNSIRGGSSSCQTPSTNKAPKAPTRP